MSLLMEALKNAEQSKKLTSSPSAITQETSPIDTQSSGTIDDESAEQVEKKQNTETISIEDDTKQLDEKNNETQSEDILDINQPFGIEDPNSAYNDVDELEWHFDLDDDNDIEQPVIQENHSELETLALELESVEPPPEVSQTPLLEQAELSAEPENFADTLLEQKTLLEPKGSINVEQQYASEFAPKPASDELIWDEGIFAPDTTESNTIQTSAVIEETAPASFKADTDLIDDKAFELDDTLIATPHLKSDITQPDPLTAKRVLQATAPAQRTNRRMTFSLLLLLLLLGVGFITYYAYQLNLMPQFPQLADFKTEQVTSQSPPPAKEQVAELPKSTEPPLVPEKIEKANLIEEIEPNPQTFMEKAKSLFAEVIANEPVESNPTTIQYQPVPENVIALVEPVQRTTTITRTQEPLITKSIIDSLDKEKPRPLPQQQNNKDIKIKKVSQNVQHMHKQLNQAYQAFQKGQNQRAQRLYQQVLNKNNKNRDALLGMAAIAQRNHQNQAAEYYYQQILKYYPDDGIAKMGLNAIQQASPRNSESQIKMLLDQSPQSAYLHFSLGNAYAQQKRWREAQQAYFDAHRFDEKKADYAYNLAVSLEYLHQPKAALPFYQKALQLSRQQATQFNPEQVKKRIQQLSR